MSKVRIHIGGLPLSCTSAEVSDLLSRAASREVKARVAVDGLTGLQRPYAFAHVIGRVGSDDADEEDAKSVVERIKKCLSGSRWKGSKLVVDIARPDPALKQKTLEEEKILFSAPGLNDASIISECVPCGRTKLAKLGLPPRILRIQRKPGDRATFVDPEPRDVVCNGATRGKHEPSSKWVKVHRASRCTTFHDIIPSNVIPTVLEEASTIGSDDAGGKDGSTVLSDMDDNQDNFPPEKDVLESCGDEEDDIGNILLKEQEQNLALLHRMCGTELPKQSSTDGGSTKMEQRSTLNSFIPTERFVPMDTSVSPEDEQALPSASSSHVSTSESVPKQNMDRYCIQKGSALTDIFRIQTGSSIRSPEEEKDAKGFILSTMFDMDEEESNHPSNHRGQVDVENPPDCMATTTDGPYLDGGALWANLELLKSEASSFVRIDPEKAIEEKWRVMRYEIMSNIRRKQKMVTERKERGSYSLHRRGKKRDNMDL